MSQKQVKKTKRAVRRERDRIIKEFIKMAKGHSFRQRLSFAWIILKG
jgi:hypothetical protein